MTLRARTLHPDEKIKAGKLGTRMVMGGMTIGIVFLVVSIVLGMMKDDSFRRFYYAYLTGWLFAISIPIGCIWFILIHHLTRSRWSAIPRRLAECVTGALPLLGLVGLLGIVVPVILGEGDLYFWASKWAKVEPNAHHLHHKATWFEPVFFAARYVIYIGIYTAMARYFTSLSRKQDETGDPNLSEKMRIASGPAILIFALTTMVFGFDMIMSLAPKWYSTIFSVNFWGGSMIGCFAFLSLLAMALQRSGRLVHSITTEHYHDLGKWIFAFVFFWAYTAFSQFMLIWYGNIPEETVFYKYRMFSEWRWVSLAMLFGQWMFPFVLLLSRWTKRIQPVLAAFAVWVLVFHWLDLYWNVMPNSYWPVVEHAGASFSGGPLTGDPKAYTIGFSPVDITAWLAMIGMLIAGVGASLKGNLIPIKDPQLPNSLGFENY